MRNVIDMLEFQADKVTIKGPRVDGSYVLSFEVGEYCQKQVAEVINIPQGTTLKVHVTYERNE